MPFPGSRAGHSQDTRCEVLFFLSIVTGKPEVSLNQKIKNLIQQLGAAIHESVSESEHIAGVVKHIREQGFDVLLMLEATIGLNEVEDTETPPEGKHPLQLTAGAASEPVDGPFTHNDLSFLKSLRIALPERVD